MRNFPIKYKLLAYIGGLLMVFFISLIFIVNNVMIDHITKSMVNDTDNITSLIADQFNKTIKESEDALNVISNASNHDIITYDLYSQFLQTIPSLNSDILNVFFFYDDGMYFIYPETTLPSDFNFKERAWYLGAVEIPGSVHWTDPYTDIVTGQMVITGAKNFNSSNLNTNVTVGIDLKLSSLSDSINQIKINDNGYMMLISDTGRIIGHKNKELINKDFNNKESDFLAFLQSSDEDLLETSDGIFIKKEINAHYNLVSFIAKKDIIAVTNTIDTFFSILMIIAFCLLIILIFYQVSRITSPINSLRKTMVESIDSDQLILSDVRTNDEINALILGYNEMATQINEKNLEMAALYEELYASEETLREQYDQLYTSREKLRKSEEQYRLIFESSSEGLWEQMPDNRLILYTSSWYNQFDIDLESSTYQDWLDLIHPDDQTQFDENVEDQHTSRESTVHGEYRIMTKEGKYMWIASVGRLLFNGDGSIKSLIGAHTDITLRKENEEKILKLAYFDSLTGLHNRFSFRDYVMGEIKKDNKLALFYIDLDNFKYINDTYGHSYGDMVLKIISDRLKSIGRKNSVISRISGDEFGIAITQYKNEDDLKNHVEDILRNINDKMIIDHLDFTTTASIGISQYPKDADTFEDLMINADMSMYKAKDANKNGYFFFNRSMKEDMMKKITLENRLGRSIEKNELYLVYQPIIDVESRKISGFESLIRWHDPELGQIYPDQFIPIAEHNKFIKQIGIFVLKETLKQGIKLKEKFNEEFILSINVSVVQLQDDEFLNTAKSILKDYPYPNDKIILEITESVTIESDPLVINRLNKFKSLGLKIALDDFGTGYSSLNNLLALPLDHLKIDRSLTNQSTSFEEVSTFIQSITTIAHTLGISVVSEGIENADTLKTAKDNGTDYVQGYMFAKPMKKELMEDYIENFTCE